MKYKTFRSVVAVLGVGLAGLGIWRCSQCEPSADPKPAVASAPTPRSVAPKQVSVRQVAEQSDATPSAGGRAVDQAMDQAVGRPVVAKIKDATKGRPFKINVYSDDGQRFNRAKVDLDRDDKWDEKWTFKPDGSTERQVAPNDDEQYTQTYVRDGASWRAL